MHEPLPPQLETALHRLYANPDPVAVTHAQNALAHTLAGARLTLYYDRIPDTPIGTVYLVANERGLVSVDFGVSEAQFFAQIQKNFGVTPEYAPELLSHHASRIQDYLLGKRTTLDLPYDISSLTPFQQQVLHAALQIPRGQVYTYADIARKIGNPNAVRAVGQALGRNPVPIVIPCHRVVAANGMGGYSGGGGLATKRKLLVLEGALMA
ncbi:MAG TPA: methylated-DNA--[protein]-cysteine S-methyltransferase [Anaerolineales bacterium]|nr:methylated-DNA--[protein]-cysteine S-methyltransferase [Anaerolineales bacterium]